MWGKNQPTGFFCTVATKLQVYWNTRIQFTNNSIAAHLVVWYGLCSPTKWGGGMKKAMGVMNFYDM